MNFLTNSAVLAHLAWHWRWYIFSMLQQTTQSVKLLLLSRQVLSKQNFQHKIQHNLRYFNNNIWMVVVLFKKDMCYKWFQSFCPKAKIIVYVLNTRRGLLDLIPPNVWDTFFFKLYMALFILGYLEYFPQYFQYQKTKNTFF